MTDDAQTEAISRVPTPGAAAREPEVAQPEAEVARADSIQEMYEAALAKLNDLHGCWVAGIATILEAEISGEREAAA